MKNIIIDNPNNKGRIKNLYVFFLVIAYTKIGPEINEAIKAAAENNNPSFLKALLILIL